MTRSLAAIAPRDRAEAIRRRLRAEGLLRIDLGVLHDGEVVAFPILAPLPAPSDDLRTEFRDFPPRAAWSAGSYRERVHLPEKFRPLLPRAFDVVGEIVLIRLPDEIVPFRSEVGRALLETVPGARLVGWDHGVHGLERRRTLERIAGDGTWRTVHRENGLAFEVDVEAAYFSPRLAREHAHVADQVGPRERVFDLCCGVGPFALTIASRRRGREIVAVDVNPRAIELVRGNLARLGLEGRVRPVEADIARFLPSAGRADRIIFNLPHEGIKYLPLGLAAVEPGGVLHYYEVTERMTQPHRARELVAMTNPRDGWTAGPAHVVHPYSPRSDLLAYTLPRAAP